VPRAVALPASLWLLLAFGAPGAARAQAPERPAWGAAAGLSGGWGTEGVAVVLEGLARYRRHQFAARVAVVSDIFEHGFYDIGVLYGVVLAPTVLDLSVGAGVAYAGVERCPGLFVPGDCERVRTVGLPLSLRLLIAPIPYFAFGLQGFGDLNSEQSFGGLTLAVYIGKLR
jgi:hypothetical protein